MNTSFIRSRGLATIGWALISLFSAFNLPAAVQELPRIEVSGTCMGPIPYEVLVVSPPEDLTRERLQSMVQQQLDLINRLMSTYVEDSDVSRFNRSESTDFVSVDPETARVVKRAQEISQASAGAFDITVGPAVNLWNFGPNKEEFQVPSDQSIESVKERVGYQKVEVRLDPPALRKTNPAVEIDLSAIAKGYAVDRVARALEQANCEHYMVQVGGEVRSLGHRQNRAPWRVGVEKPDAYRQIPDAVAELSGKSMATSGDYRNYRRVGKVRYSHTIDPTTSRPVTHDLASACVIADDCMTADALATAVMVLGLQRGEAFLKERGVNYFLVQRNSDFGQQLTRVASPGFPFAGGERPEDVLLQAPKPAVIDEAGESIWPAFIGALVVFALVITGMAVGAMFGNRPVQGSCGGLANMTNEDGESSCQICEKPTSDCIERQPEASNPVST